MADPERGTVTVSAFAIITAAIQSTNALKETVQRFKQRNKTLGRLQNDLEDLSRTLFTLRQMVDTDASVLALLQGPIEQCSRLCREFEDFIKAFDTRSKTDFQDWAGMRFMGGDINEFIDTLAGYKSTISIGLCTVTMHASKVSDKVREEYNEMVKDTSYGLQEHLQRIDEELAQLAIKNSDNLDGNLDLDAERVATQQCLRICEDTRVYIKSLANQESSLSQDFPQSAADGAAVQNNALTQSIDPNELPIAAGAGFGKHMDRIEEICLPGTRTELLLDIQRWAIAADGKRIFWLNSLAGTGKSTIARTVAKAFQEQGLLGASFFFKRGEGDRGNAARFFPTIIQQLSSRIPELRAAILQVIQDNPEISAKSLKEQFNELIYKPFRSLNQASLQNSPLVVVVDALDECEHDNDIQVLLQLFPRVQEFNSPCLRFFITSRPELPIRSGFRAVDYHDLSLHEIPQPIIERDIALFLQHKMAIIREQRKLPSGWPEKDDIQALLTVSAPSFIVAATVCSHLQNHNLEPTQYLNEVVARLNEGPKVGEPPLAILNRLFGAQTEYGPQPSADYGHDAGIESLLYDHSDIESIFSEGSILSSQSSQSEITSIAISELAELLLTDNELQNLWPTAISKVGPDRFQRNFTRILRKFGRNLEGEALNEIQYQSAHFVRLSAQQTAAQLCNLLKQDRSKLPFEQSSNASRTARVNAWLQSQKVGHTKQVEGLLEVDATGSSTDSDVDGSEEFNPASLSNLDDVKLFLLSANAFLLLREEFKKWLEVKRTDSGNPAVQKNFQFSDPETTQDSRFGDLVQSSMSEGHHHEPVQFREDCDNPPEGASTDQISTNGMVISLSWWQRLLNIYFPQVAGYERIYFRCGCGEVSYVDAKELSVGGINRFRQRLLASIAGISNRPHGSPDSSPIKPPPQAHINPSIGTPASGRNRPRKDATIYYPPQTTMIGSTQAGDSIFPSQESRFLLMCVNTKNSTKLVHINVDCITNDQNLFREVYQEYQRVRHEHEFRITNFLPLWASNLLHAISARFSITTLSLPGIHRFLSVLSSAVGAMHLHKISSGDFVRFQLVPIGVDCCPRWFKARDIPPETEVKARRYIYEPVPMKDVELADIPLRHLLKPGPHFDNFWLSTFPKKIRDPLVRLPGPDGQHVIGWGIRVNECLNWTMILLSILIILLVTCASVIIYATITTDNSSAFAFGSFMVAMLAVYLSYQYFAWREAI